MPFRITNIDSLLGRARRAQHRYETRAAQLNGLLELALDAEASGKPVPNPVIRQLQSIVETDEKLFNGPDLSPKRQSPFSKRKTQRTKKVPAKGRKRERPLR
jgi:hypothetical protein